jgi:type II secretory pathway pseudopilin PulG
VTRHEIPIRRAAGSLRRAFSLVELLVAMAVIIIVVAIIGPAIARIIESNNYTSAVNSVTGTLGNARALAMRTGRATAVIFLYDAETERTTLQVLQEAPGATSASLTDASGGNVATYGGSTQAAAFSPALGVPPVALPGGIGVFGLRPEGYSPQDILIDRITSGWYAGESEFTDPDSNRRITPWIFPRNDPSVFLSTVDADGDPWRNAQDRIDISEDAVRAAQSFGVLFTDFGSIGAWFEIGGGKQIQDAVLELPGQPRLLEDGRDEPRAYDDPRLFDPEAEPSDPERGEPNPEVRFRTVSQLAVVNLRTLNETFGTSTPLLARLRPSTALVAPPAAATIQVQVVDDDDFLIPPPERDRLVGRISAWIDANAEIISFNRYSGAVIRREFE